MSAEVLRRAAAAIRAEAEHATPGPWSAEVHPMRGSSPVVKAGEVYVAHYTTSADADTIAAWHPVVALAVADLFDRAAGEHDETPCPAIDAAITVAQAYLGVPPC